MIEHNQTPQRLSKSKRDVFICCGSRGLVYGFREPKRIVQLRSWRKGELHQGGQMFHTEACSTKLRCLPSRSSMTDSLSTLYSIERLRYRVNTVKLPGSKTIPPTALDPNTYASTNGTSATANAYTAAASADDPSAPTPATQLQGRLRRRAHLQRHSASWLSSSGSLRGDQRRQLARPSG